MDDLRDIVIKLQEAHRGCKEVREREYKEMSKRIDRIDNRMWAIFIMMVLSFLGSMTQIAMAVFKK